MLYELLAKQYEVARLDEAKDSSVIQVLDVAEIPERKSKPRLLLMMVLGGAIGAAVAIALALALDMFGQFLTTPTGARQWQELRSCLHLRATKGTS